MRFNSNRYAALVQGRDTYKRQTALVSVAIAQNVVILGLRWLIRVANVRTSVTDMDCLMVIAKGI